VGANKKVGWDDKLFAEMVVTVALQRGKEERRGRGCGASTYLEPCEEFIL
jgi:hypothetical protein